MSNIGQIDAIVNVLRQRLQARSRAAKKGDGRERLTTQPNVVRALAGMEGVADRQLARAVIQQILMDQFGRGMINEPKFQQVVEKVTESLQSEPDGAQLLAQVVNELRSSQ